MLMCVLWDKDPPPPFLVLLTNEALSFLSYTLCFGVPFYF